MIIRHLLDLIRVLTTARANLVLENLALRQQLAVLERSVSRPKIRTRDRVFWVLLRRLWSGWRNALLVVRPETVVGWHRKGWRLVWRARSQGTPGRPQIPEDVRELIRRLSEENRLWGAPRIQLELERLGHHVALSTIDKYRTRWSGSPSPTLRAFLRNHAGEILACDFFTIPTVTFKTVVGFVVMDLDRRRILACEVTAHPTAIWAADVVRRAVEAGGGVARYLLRDRDAIYGGEFAQVVPGLGLRQMVTAYKAPLQNAHVERLIGTLRRECLDHMIVFSEEHARRTLAEFADYYNGYRVHQGLNGERPVERAPTSPDRGDIIAKPHMGGLHHSYERAA